MKLVLVGCEYSGTTTLAHGAFRWVNETIDGGMLLFHDHWKIPFTSGHQEHDPPLSLTEEEQEQVLALSPKLKEMTQRHSLYYHTSPEALGGDDYMAGGLHIEEAIYAPLYFGYGLDGPRPDFKRSIIQDIVEKRIVTYAPEMVLALVKASPDVIARRMREAPHHRQVVPERDIELVSRRFEEEYERSAIANKLVLDTTTDTVDETMARFVEQIEPHLSESDKVRILVEKARQRGQWLRPPVHSVD